MARSLRCLVVLASALVVMVAAPPARADATQPPPVAVQVILATHHVVAGHPIKGAVVLTNTTRNKITVNTCALDGWLQVGLHGKVDSLPFGGFLVGCAPTVRLAPGARRFPVTVITTYASCTQASPGRVAPVEGAAVHGVGRPCEPAALARRAVRDEALCDRTGRPHACTESSRRHPHRTCDAPRLSAVYRDPLYGAEPGDRSQRGGGQLIGCRRLSWQERACTRCTRTLSGRG